MTTTVLEDKLFKMLKDNLADLWQDDLIAEAGQKPLQEKWSQKYKSSINCSHPKGFSQKAHCAGKKKHNEDITMEAVCPDCGMCQTHGTLNEIKKGAKDSNGFTKCWPGKHAEGTKKGKNGGRVRNCVPNESQGVAEGLKSMYHNAVAKHHGRKADDAFDNGDEEGFKKSMDKNISHKLKAGEKIPQVRDPKKFQQGVAEGYQLDEGLSFKDYFNLTEAKKDLE